ncbi:hypothetical protein GS429_01220 [Natronorubrum sp. JWXQ-INN-674]|uniref:CARDB domain-containing protein n=1 Tax=Natronorubrum halalkaliphilum TaxID=2691917 RepID=A0A6B0VG08_9EURY|nr:hypothetical protein [Natronorubrum halalkaliphilum]MXV60711.1 hypothetical protein [Natronorubrum halalkaliphilum]
MERRTFIATTGTGIGIGVGVAGCLNADDGSSEGNGTTELEDDDEDGDGTANGDDDEDGDGTANGDDDEGGNGTRDEGDDEDTTESTTDDADGTGDDENTESDETSDDADESVSTSFEVTAMRTTSPVGGGERLEVVARVENVGYESGTADIDLVVGHDPTIEDSQTLTLESGESSTVTLGFQAGEPAGDVEEFPVRVDTGTDEAVETVVVEAGDGADDDSGDESVTFESCTRATVSGSFEDGDVAYASTGFYDRAGFGNTLMEDGVTVGDDVDAPFSGTIVFEIGDGQGVAENGDEIVVTVGDYGEYGTVIGGLTTDPDDYMVAGITHGNPHAEECLEEIESEWADDTGG